MESRTLTQTEIQKIYQFVAQNGVPYIDLQHELVDHIAGGIEETWANDESITFNQCLYEKYDEFQFDHKKKYPVSNFDKILKERTKALEKYWTDNVIKYLFEYFRPPLIIITLLLFGCINMMFQNGEAKLLGALLVFSVLFILLLSGIFYFKYKKEFNEYLVIRSFVMFYFNILFMIPNGLIGIIKPFASQEFIMTNTSLQLILSALLSFWIIIVIGSITTFPSILKRDVMKQLNIRLA